VSWYQEQFRETFGIESTDTLEQHAEGFVTVDEAMGMVESRVNATDYGRLREELGLVEEAVFDVSGAFDTLQNNIDERKAWRDFRTTLFYFRNDMFVTTEEADAFALALGNIVNELDGIDDETRIKLLTELDRGDLDYVLGALERLRQGVTVPIRPSPTNIGLPQLPGNPAAPTITNVVPNVPTIQRPNVGLPISSESTGTMTINISTSADPNEVIRAIETYRRRNGTTVV
jgi:hypothetical protein